MYLCSRWICLIVWTGVRERSVRVEVLQPWASPYDYCPQSCEVVESASSRLVWGLTAIHQTALIPCPGNSPHLLLFHNLFPAAMLLPLLWCSSCTVSSWFIVLHPVTYLLRTVKTISVVYTYLSLQFSANFTGYAQRRCGGGGASGQGKWEPTDFSRCTHEQLGHFNFTVSFQTCGKNQGKILNLMYSLLSFSAS